MKIGIDARKILNPEKGEAAGIGHYTYHLLRHLLEIDKKNKYVLFFDYRLAKKKLEKFKQKNVEIKYLPFYHYKRYLGLVYSRLLVTATLARENLDVFHFPAGNIPAKYTGKKILTVHDLAVWKHPDLFARPERRQARSITSSTLKNVEKIITVSRATASDIKEIFKVGDEKIKVIHNGIDKRFFIAPRAVQIKKNLLKYRIKKDYILYLGQLEPRKNLTRLIGAFTELKRRYLKENFQLVIAGRSGWLAKEIRHIATETEYYEDIIFTGYVEPDDLTSIFGGAKLFVFPSIYEGFGMPVVEAMACQVPVVLSDTPALKEVAAGAGVFVNPYNISGLAEAMWKVLNNNSLRETLIKNGLERAHQFNWEKCARETLKVYEEVA